MAEELGIGSDNVLKVLKPLYGVLEAGNHWFKTYHTHYVKELGIEQSTYDLCLLHCKEPFGLVGLQIDDILFLIDSAFIMRESDGLAKAQFAVKEREQLTATTPIKFNGGIIKLANGTSPTSYDITLT
jgi:hypothetical protein